MLATTVGDQPPYRGPGESDSPKFDRPDFAKPMHGELRKCPLPALTQSYTHIAQTIHPQRHEQGLQSHQGSRHTRRCGRT